MPLSADQQALVEAAGRQLATGTDRYGNVQPDSNASLVHVRRKDAQTVSLRVQDAVGVIAIPGLQIHVRPKIPTAHLLHILQASAVLPRMAPGQASLQQDDSLASLIAHWCVSATERVVEEGLARDYRMHREELRAVRGRILPLQTARLLYRGQLSVLADYEEYDFDTPLNRVLLQASRLVAAGTALPSLLRRRALRVAKRMDGVGRLAPADLAAAHTDRRTHYYAPALELSRQVIAATGRTLDAGARRSWTFLFRTPAPVEAGIRAIAQHALGDKAKVRKGQKSLSGAGMTINPDLVFTDSSTVRAIGDVKYKLVGTEWERADLYEVVAFAEGYEVKPVVVTMFRGPNRKALPAVEIGRHRITQVYWPADEALAPATAALAFVQALQAWYEYDSALPA